MTAIKTPETTELEITQDYRNVINAIEREDPFIFVSGKAGTGKTTLIGYLSIQKHTESKQRV